MVTEVNILSEIPDKMAPGMLCVLENAEEANKGRGDPVEPYFAVLACPECGTVVLITQAQGYGVKPIMCENRECPASYFLGDDCETIIPRKPS